MKLLISTYACAPYRGSEHAVGWTWVSYAHRLGHQVWALVAPNHQDSILRTCKDHPELAGITWLFPKVPGWPLEQAIEPRWERTYNVLWQVSAAKAAHELHEKVAFDAIHHLTWGGIRAPTFLGSVGAPLIVGPIGGGETSPRPLRDAFHLKAKITEAVRDLSNNTIRLNPLVRHGLVSAAAIFTKTPETTRILTRSMQEKSISFLEVGIEGARPPRPPRAPGPPRLLFAGRLLYWKGAHIAIETLAEVVRIEPDVRLTIVGKGKEEHRLREAAVAHGVESNIKFEPWLPQEKLYELYQTHDLFVYPSLHDSSGNVVLEALSFGLPVVCLDLGGPARIVTPDAGAIISTGGLDTAQVAAAMGAAIVRFLRSPKLLRELSCGAVARAADFTLSCRVAQFYETVEKVTKKVIRSEEPTAAQKP
jgi:glycosyltransferase involved in cell wall biosynthesis